MSLALACFGELYICIPNSVLNTAQAMNKNIPAHCHPIGSSVLLQVLCAALYSALLEYSNNDTLDRSDIQETPRSIAESYSFDPQDRCASATALGEALCSIDEDNKHTDQIDDLLHNIEQWLNLIISG